MRLDQANQQFVAWYLAQPQATQDALQAVYDGVSEASDPEYNPQAPNAYYYCLRKMIGAAAQYGWPPTA